MVSSREVKQRGTTQIHPKFSIPVGLIDAVQGTGGVVPADVQEDDSNDGVTIIDIGGNDQPDPQPSFAYQPPTNITIASQVVRILPDGSHVVDVLVDITDVPGISQYNVRTTKTS